MRNKLLLLTVYLCVISALGAKEPSLAILQSTISNEIQKFILYNKPLECRAYGIITLEKLYQKSKINSECRKSIDKFFIKYPKKKFFVELYLHTMQQYHIEMKKTRCIIYANGQITLSEVLLKEGLAIMEPLFNDEEFGWYFKMAQRKAKSDENGLWGENIFNRCIVEINN